MLFLSLNSTTAGNFSPEAVAAEALVISLPSLPSDGFFFAFFVVGSAWGHIYVAHGLVHVNN